MDELHFTECTQSRRRGFDALFLYHLSGACIIAPSFDVNLRSSVVTSTAKETENGISRDDYFTMTQAAVLIGSALCAMLFLSIPVTSEEGVVKIYSEHVAGFYGVFKMNVTSDVTNGWHVTLRFSKPVGSLKPRNAVVKVVSEDKTIFKLANTIWNPRLTAGRILKIVFYGKKAESGAKAPTVAADFKRD
ncbi:uncharacterized protein LOC5512896 [Nematostella vectensis]|uniref:uncharacterized protein LOC5512896 n=1 Tax=Nematostella vectensis TaxID=45351 RepID=UPI0020774D25|nr:uncharacterized protein LOC5512896 [Nematostella vectensis]